MQPDGRHRYCATRIRVGGRVQGVGYRPFAYRTAVRIGVQGWVLNRGAIVEILAEGSAQQIDTFIVELLDGAPPLARPQLLERRAVPLENHREFIIRSSSDAAADLAPSVPPDYFMCKDCLSEIGDPGARRYRYPFTNCTQCGPRYTLIRALPYDRENTAMSGFPLCEQCRSEFDDPMDRRFHAQPLACARCGPELTFRQGSGIATGNEPAISASVKLLQDGGIVAVKGVGGYHLLCDATNPRAVGKLRQRKARPHKPLAVLFPLVGPDTLQRLREELEPSAAEAERLVDPERPIVLCRRRQGSVLAENIAPGLAEIGAMLPYSPIHFLLSHDIDGPLVATSGNIGGEPVLVNNREAEDRLACIADGFLHHNRPILRPADDSVERYVAGASRPVRLGRGIAPLSLSLRAPLEPPLLAVGGHNKNTFAFGRGASVIISPHIGDLESPRSLRVFEQTIQDLQRLYRVEPDGLVCDAHPDYASTRWAKKQGLTVHQVFHHHAHASALYEEAAGQGSWLTFTWDGVGLGEDGTLWGGEALLGSPGHWKRIGSIRPFRLPGGEKAAREPWRSALAFSWECGYDWRPPVDRRLIRHAWEMGLNTPISSAVGRLFDAAAAILGLCESASFEGQAAMYLESIATPGADPVTLPILSEASGLWRLDWAPLLEQLFDERLSREQRAGCIHSSLADGIIRMSCLARDIFGIAHVGLAGGVFQNRLLVENAVAGLESAGLSVHLPERVPCNDAGLSFGQLVEVAGRRHGQGI